MPGMAPSGRHRRHRDDAGQSSAEYLGVVVVVAAIVVALLGSGVASSVATGLQRAVCSVAARSCGAAGPDGTAGSAYGGGAGAIDRDGDGFSDADELLAGSDPGSPDAELPVPPPQAPPTPDEGSAPFGSADPGLDDRLTEQMFARLADLAELRGMTNAARNMRWYLGASGETLAVDPEAMLRDMPEFAEAVRRSLSAVAEEAGAAADARYDGRPLSLPLQGEWRPFDANGVDDDWFYALGGFSYSLSAVADVAPPASSGGPPTITLRYRLDVADRYNWDKGKGVTIGPISVSDTQLQRLQEVGLAREYDVAGSSALVQVSLPLEAPGGDAPLPGYPDRDRRDGERGDPGRDRGDGRSYGR